MKNGMMQSDGGGADAVQTHVLHELEPIWDEDSRVLVLGTMPSPRSREAGFYYAHPQNRFWRTLACVLGEETPLTDEGRRSLALRHGIAIWDVLKSCDIEGASDASIKNPVPNPLSEIIENSRIRAVFTTGQRAFKLYDQLCAHQFPELNVVCLPSTSPANRRLSDDGLVAAYGQIKAFLSEESSS